MVDWSEERIRKISETLQSQYKEKLTENDAVEILNNLTVWAELLIDCYEGQKK